MPNFIAVVAFDPATRRVVKYQEFPTKPEADDHVLAHGGFVSARPIGGVSDWQVNVPGNALSRVPMPPPPSPQTDRPHIVAIKRLATNAGVNISDLNL